MTYGFLLGCLLRYNLLFAQRGNEGYTLQSNVEGKKTLRVLVYKMEQKMARKPISPKGTTKSYTVFLVTIDSTHNWSQIDLRI